MTDLTTLSDKIDTLSNDVGMLSTDATDLFSEVTTLKNGVEDQIADAVLVSVNATQIPLISIATSIINTQASFVTYINGENL
jgi:outer membrane murein-binding lipoprotein Lpp